MCSPDPQHQLAQIGHGIEALTAESPGAGTDLPELSRRIDQLWAMMADLSPELAGRLRKYCPDPGQPSTGQPGHRDT